MATYQEKTQSTDKKVDTSFLFGEDKTITSPVMDDREHPVEDVTRPHEGIDIKVSVGTAIVAPVDGIIAVITENSDKNKNGEVDDGYGYYIVIQHTDENGDLTGQVTQYGHLKELPNLKVGDEIKAGEVFAYTGNTGASTGPHLHYEERELPNSFKDSDGNWKQVKTYNDWKINTEVLDPAEDNFKFQEAHKNRQELKEWLSNHEDSEMQQLASVIEDDWLNINSDYIIPSNNAVLTGNQAQNLEDKLRQVSKQWDKLLNDEMKDNTIESAIKEALGKDNIFNDGISFDAIGDKR